MVVLLSLNVLVHIESRQNTTVSRHIIMDTDLKMSFFIDKMEQMQLAVEKHDLNWEDIHATLTSFSKLTSSTQEIKNT